MALAVAGTLLAGTAANADTPLTQPEIASNRQDKPGWATRHFAVAAANPLAVEAGYKIVKAGGSAVDAAIAVQMVLTLVEPQSSGLGGGAFMLTFDGQKTAAWDGRETAPAAARSDQFMWPDGRPMTVSQAIVGGLSVGTPGVLAMLAAAHREQGRLPWAKLFEPAIALAEQGFAISPRLYTLLKDERALQGDAQARAYFFDAQGQPWPVGHRLRNPALAAVLKRIAAGGPEAFYRGPIAADMARRVSGNVRPGPLREADLAGYEAKKVDALCADWRSYRICGMPPPSSGQLTIMQILKMLEDVPGALAAPASGKPEVGFLHRYAEASRLAYADRAQYIGDPAFVTAPGGNWQSLLDDSYLKSRAALIGERSMPDPAAGQPRSSQTAYAPQAYQAEYGTSHISIIDAQGHAVAITTSVESGFGSRIMSDGGTGLVGGFILNNQMTDFSMSPNGTDGRPVANRLEPGKRPRSSMSPTLVFDAKSGRLLMSLGAPGGQVIIHYVAKTLIGTLAWGMDAQRAVDLPNYGSINGPIFLEEGGFTPAVIKGLEALGHGVREVDLPSGIQAIERSKTGWYGAADPRREGIVKGD
jgi:gamma-glutamyltranspeptidase/glutathione hydrolase